MTLFTLILEDDSGEIIDARQIKIEENNYPTLQIQNGKITLTGKTTHLRKDIEVP